MKSNPCLTINRTASDTMLIIISDSESGDESNVTYNWGS